MKRIYLFGPLALLTLLTLLALLPLFAAAQRERIDSVLRAIQHPLPDSVMMRCYLRLGRDYDHISVDTSVYYATEGTKLAKKLHNRKAEGEGFSILGTNEKNKGNYEKSLSYHLKALKIREELNDERGLATTNNDIGMLYRSTKRHIEARKYFLIANQYCRKVNLGKGIALSDNNIGTTYRETNNPDSALYYYKKALGEAEECGDTRAISTCLTNMGDMYADQGNQAEALKAFRKSLEYDRGNEDKQGMVISYSNVARTLLHLNHYPEAIPYTDSAIRTALDEEMVSERLEAYRLRTYIEKSAGNYAKAYEYQNKYIDLKDSMINRETQDQISEIQTKYETAKKEQQISLQQSEIKRKNYVIMGIGGLLGLSTLLGFSYYNRYRLKQRTKLQEVIIQQQDLATRAVIEAEERERKRIAGDLHDGVGQLMSAAKMNLSMIGDELSFNSEEQKQSFDKVMSLVDEGCREVRSVSHTIMPNALLKSGLASAIRESINKLDQRVIQVNLYTEGLNDRINGNIESVLYRVMQECVNNVIKHSGASKLDISLIRDEEGISVTIEDNGKGFDASDKTKFNGIGLKNIQSRVEYLKGTVEWDSSPGKGTVVVINIPVNALPEA